MGALKKMLMGLGIAIAAIIVFLFTIGLIGLYWVTTPPKFEVKSVAIVDYDNYPAIKIVFETDKYPVKFYLMTPEGEKIYGASASKPEKVVYLYLTPMKPHTNIVKEKRYMIKALYLGNVIWEKKIDIKGVRPVIEVVSVKGKPSTYKLTLELIIIKVKNLGDVPLYVTSIPKNVRVYIDDKEAPCRVEMTILPNEDKEVKIELFLVSIGFDVLDKEHSVKVEIANRRVEYIIPKLNPELKLLDRKYGEFLGTTYLDNVTISIMNDWIFPIHTKWIRVFINGEEHYVSIIPEEIEEIGVGETVKLTLKGLVWLAKKGSKVEIVLGASRLEFKA